MYIAHIVNLLPLEIENPPETEIKYQISDEKSCESLALQFSTFSKY